jgi:hypothetical protein
MARDLLDEAVFVATSRLRDGDRLEPVMILERWGVRHFERFEDHDLSAAKSALSRFVLTPGDDFGVLVYYGRVGHDEDAILVEHARAGGRVVEVFAQRFRPRRGPLRGFKLIGDLRHVGSVDASPAADEPAQP